MVLTRNTGLDLSKISIQQMISDQEKQERMTQSNASNSNSNLTDPHNTNSSIIKISTPLLIDDDGTETKTAVFSKLNNQTLTPATNESQIRSSNHLVDSNEDKELGRIPYFNGKANVYAWLMAVKSVFIDLKYDENTWANKAKYYLLDHAAQYVYLNDDQMTNWNNFRKSMIDQYSSNTIASDLTYSNINTTTDTNVASQQKITYSSDILAQRAHHALVLEDLKTLPKFSGEDSQSITLWLEEIELIYDKAFITDTDRCSRTLKLLCNADEKWMEFIRRQKLEWNEFKQKLTSRFEGKKDPSRIQREDDVRNRHFHENESMHQYYSDIMRKCDLLEEEYPVSDRHRIDYIIRGLPDSIQDQLLVREYSTPKELLEVLQKIEERRKRINFEQHVFIEDSIHPQTIKSSPSVQTIVQTTSNTQLNTLAEQQPAWYNSNTGYNNQSHNYPQPRYHNANHRPPPRHYNTIHSAPTPRVPNYNQQRPQQHRSIQCYNCGRFGHKSTECFKPKQHLN